MVSRRSRLLLGLASMALVLAACGSGANGDETSGAAEPAGSASPAGSGGPNGPPAFATRTLAGAKIDSASFAGKPTVLWFWAPWCTICRAEAPDVAEAAKAFKGKVDLVGVAGRGEVPAMKDFVSETGTGGFTHAVDTDGTIWTDYGVAAQPAFAFIDAKGDVQVVVGSLGKADLEKQMQALAATA